MKSVVRSSSLGKAALVLLCAGLACAVPQLLAKKKDKAAEPGANEQKRAVQALNRLTFGPRPGDVQQVMAMGVDHWIDLQLHPEKIPDSAIEARLAPFRTLRMSSQEIVEEFPDNQMIKQMVDGKRSMPSDPATRAIVQVQIARLQEKKDRKEEAGAESASPATASAPVPAGPAAADTAKTAEELAAAAAADREIPPDGAADANGMSAAADEHAGMAPAAMSAGSTTEDIKHAPANDAEARRREDRLYADSKVQELINLPPDQRYKKVMAMSTDEQLAFAESLRGKGSGFSRWPRSQAARNAAWR